MFEEQELTKLLSEDETTISMTISSELSKQVTQSNFNQLATFINTHQQCHTLKLLLDYPAKITTWQFIGQAIASTHLRTLDLTGNYLGTYKNPWPESRITALFEALQPNRTLYRLFIQNTHMDRTSLVSMESCITARPLWLKVSATQETLRPPTCSLVDASVAKNVEALYQEVIENAQVAVTHHPVEEQPTDFRSLLKQIYSLPKDIINHINHYRFFSGKHHPINAKITSAMITAYKIAQQHPQNHKIEQEDQQPNLVKVDRCFIM